MKILILLVIVQLFHLPISAQTGLSKTISLPHHFEILAEKGEQFENLTTYHSIKIRQNNQILFQDTTAEYELNGKQFPFFRKLENGSFELLIEQNNRPNFNQLLHLILENGRITQKEMLPFFEKKPKDIDNDGKLEWAGFWDISEQWEEKGISKATYNPLVFYELSKNGIVLDKPLTIKLNRKLMGRFHGFEYSEKFTYAIPENYINPLWHYYETLDLDKKMLKSQFQKLLSPYNPPKELIQHCFDLLEKNYSESTRHYHTLRHVQNLLVFWKKYKAKLQNADDVAFAIYFHDVIYDTHRPDNEEKSAEYTQKILEQCHFSKVRIDKIIAYILATKTHQNPNQDADLDYFLDFDLSILAAEPDEYETYTQQIRKEYQHYEDDAYKKGRSAVLQHFLDKPYIFKTAIFQEQFEQKAKTNISLELEYLRKM